MRADGRQLGKKLAVLVGLVAGMGLAIKPYFLLFWVVVEIVLFFSDRQAWKRTENVCIVGVQALYVFMVIGLTPGYLKMIEIASTVYDTYGAPGSPMLLVHSSVAWYLVAAGLFVLVRPLAFDRQPRRFLLAGSLGFLAVALVQGKGLGLPLRPADGRFGRAHRGDPARFRDACGFSCQGLAFRLGRSLSCDLAFARRRGRIRAGSKFLERRGTREAAANLCRGPDRGREGPRVAPARVVFVDIHRGRLFRL